MRIAAAVVALVLAVVLALLARDVRAWQTSIKRGDKSFQVSPGPDGLWEPDAVVPGGLAKRALGLDDDLRLREAGQLMRLSRPRAAEQRTTRDLAKATSAEVGFASVQQDTGAPRQLRSAAANELGVLSFADVISNPDQAAQRSRKAVQKFTEAIKLDAANRTAMANLELMLTLLRADDPRVDPEGVDTRGGGTASGAGSSSGGKGF